MKFIHIKGARVHNLKNIDVKIPKSKLTVITGPSGSGKSTLAFDILYAEGQRRYLESLSAYARQFLEKIDKPDIDSIDGLSPAISIDQKSVSKNPRSTVGTITEIYDYMRLLFAHTGDVFCYSCGRRIDKQTPQAIVQKIMKKKNRRIMILAPIAVNKKGSFKTEFEKFLSDGFVRVIVDDSEYMLDEEIEIDKNKKHNIFLVVDRLIVKNDSKTRITDSVELALKISSGIVYIKDMVSKKDEIFSEHFVCPYCGINYKPITPQSFSFNSPLGACKECYGLGVKHQLDFDKLIPNPNLSLREGAIKLWRGMKYSYYEDMLFQTCRTLSIDLYTPFEKLKDNQKDIILHGYTKDLEYGLRTGSSVKKKWIGIINLIIQQFSETDSPKVRKDILLLMKEMKCPVCGGDRLNKESLSVKILNKNIIEATRLSIKDAYKYFTNVQNSFDEYKRIISDKLLKEIKVRLKFLIDVGLDYLSLDRGASTLSGGESQRIRLATQAGSNLTGIIYVLDEPSIGLHPRDTDRLIKTLKDLRDNDNTVVVVEHDENIIKAADYIVDMGPLAGIKGGEVTAVGTPDEIEKNANSLTGKYLSGKFNISTPEICREPHSFISIKKAHVHNLKNIDVDFPAQSFVCVTGVSGSGKSSLVFDCLYNFVKHKINREEGRAEGCGSVENIDKIDKVIKIDQSPIGRTPRSNPATYTSVFTDIRELFAKLPDAQAQGFKPSRFSFNVKGGRCEKCRGEGVIKIEMQFLPDVYVKCDACGARRYNETTLDIKYKGSSIFNVLEMTVNQAYEAFSNIPKIKEKLSVIKDVGLGYLKLGQNATTLSGGEAQRIKIARELMRPTQGNALYLLDEPSIGLHIYDVKKLIDVLNRLVDAGNSVIVIEHNLDIIKSADYIIDLGPESGDRGGEVVGAGNPKDFIKHSNSYTALYLRKKLTA